MQIHSKKQKTKKENLLISKKLSKVSKICFVLLMLEPNDPKSPPPNVVLNLPSPKYLIKLFVLFVVVVVVVIFGCCADDEAVKLAVAEEEEHEEESSFILSRLATTTSCSRSKSKVCACDAGYTINNTMIKQ